MSKENVVYTHNEIPLGLKKMENIQYGTTWMNLENTMPSEISQLQKNK